MSVQTPDLAEAEAAIHRVEGIMGGEPVFKGTRVPVDLVAAMLAGGAGETEILEGYPSLDHRMLALARLWAGAHPAAPPPRTLADDGLRPKSVTHFALRGDPRPARSRLPAAG